MDFSYLQTLRRVHPAWRLLANPHAPLVCAFLHRCFIEPNLRSLPEEEVVARLEDFLFGLRDQLGLRPQDTATTGHPERQDKLAEDRR